MLRKGIKYLIALLRVVNTLMYTGPVGGLPPWSCAYAYSKCLHWHKPSIFVICSACNLVMLLLQLSHMVQVSTTAAVMSLLTCTMCHQKQYDITHCSWTNCTLTCTSTCIDEYVDSSTLLTYCRNTFFMVLRCNALSFALRCTMSPHQ